MTNQVDFDQYTDNYNDLLRENTQFFSPNEAYFAQYKVDIVKQNTVRPVQRILEYGCGIGRNVPFLQTAFPNAEIFGTDVSVASLEMAKKENPNAQFFEEGDACKDLGQFDLIFIAGVFHHIPVSERDGAVKELAKRLTKDGSMFIFEHNPYNPITRRIVSSCPYDEDAVLLKPSELKKRLVHGNFSIKKLSYCLFIPPRLNKLSKIENYLGWLPLGGQYWVEAKKR